MQKLDSETTHELLKIAKAAARSAGEYIASRRGEKLDITHKENRSSLASQVLTEVDLKSQEIIFEALKPTCKKYDFALLSEEEPDDQARLEKDYFWCIDPLDGTLPFINGTNGFSVSIGLTAHSGIPELGVIYDPVDDILYEAINHVGAKRNDEALKPISIPDEEQSTISLIVDHSCTKHPLFDDLVSKMKNHWNDVKIVDHGGGALNAMWVLENGPACYVRFPRPGNEGGSLWDYAASACIYETMGMEVYTGDIFGEPLELNYKNSTYVNHKGVLYASSLNTAKTIMQICKDVLPE